MPNPKGNPTTLAKYTPKWKHGNTRTIRVPVALAEQILEYAHKLDNGTLSQVNENGVNHIDINCGRDSISNIDKLQDTLTQVIEALENACSTPHTSKFTKSLRTSIQLTAIKPLKTLSQALEKLE
jgi:hypothetical protein